jgi:NADH:ubiquinone oxidoreductase subunit 6 (subunit J)
MVYSTFLADVIFPTPWLITLALLVYVGAVIVPLATVLIINRFFIKKSMNKKVAIIVNVMIFIIVFILYVLLMSKLLTNYRHDETVKKHNNYHPSQNTN